MTDLEMMRLCAEAMGYRFKNASGAWDEKDEGSNFDPLHNDAQAMALVKKLKLGLEAPYFRDKTPSWEAYFFADEHGAAGADYAARAVDLNRAICECVAKMQAAKVPA